MSSLLAASLALVLLNVDAEKPVALRYLRPAQGKFVLESEVTTTPTSDGLMYVSRTDRATEKMTLTLRYDRKHQLIGAEALLEAGKDRKTAALTLSGEQAQLKRGGTTDFFKAATNPIVTTAPDWTDIFELVRRYDGRKGGRQEFAGVWIHPVQPVLLLTFAIERVGKDAIQVKDQPVTLERYQIRLRSGDYLAWADAAGRVIKLIPAKRPAALVVLEGYEEAARSLGGGPDK
jgi:hypothetical protein